MEGYSKLSWTVTAIIWPTAVIGTGVGRVACVKLTVDPLVCAQLFGEVLPPPRPPLKQVTGCR